MYCYIKRYGEFVLVDDQTGRDVSSHGEKILGIAVSITEDGGFCLHKHGGYDWVEKWIKTRKERYSALANQDPVNKQAYMDIADGLKLYKVENCLLEDLNRILHTSALTIKYLDFLQPVDLGDRGISDQLKSISDAPSKATLLSREDIRSAIRDGADREIIRQDNIQSGENS